MQPMLKGMQWMTVHNPLLARDRSLARSLAVSVVRLGAEWARVGGDDNAVTIGYRRDVLSTAALLFELQLRGFLRLSRQPSALKPPVRAPSRRLIRLWAARATTARYLRAGDEALAQSRAGF
jgi:hypothetical protein